MEITRHTVSRLFFACVLICWIFGCQKDKNASFPDRVTVGALFPLSGDLADKGEDSANGIRLANEKINSTGGIAVLDAAGAALPMLDTAGGTVSPEYTRNLGPLAEGVLTMAEFSEFAAGGSQLNERFQERFNTDITGDSAHAYQSVLVLKDALERSASTDRKALRDALATTDIRKGPNLVLPAERLRFDQNGQNSFPGT